jgi:hypothetical protein
LQVQLEGCSTIDSCSANGFVGPDGTPNTFYSENMNNTATTPVLSIGSAIQDPYVMYNFILQSDVSGISPQIPIGTFEVQ